MRAREPMIWGVVVTVVWIAAVAVIAVAAGGDEPTIAAGSVVTALAAGIFVVGIVAGAVGRPFDWNRYLAVASCITLAAAVLVAAIARWQWEAVIYVPIVALVAGMIGWVMSMLGWLLGGVVRVAVGHRDHEDEGII